MSNQDMEGIYRVYTLQGGLLYIVESIYRVHSTEYRGYIQNIKISGPIRWGIKPGLRGIAGTSCSRRFWPFVCHFWKYTRLDLEYHVGAQDLYSQDRAETTAFTVQQEENT